MATIALELAGYPLTVDDDGAASVELDGGVVMSVEHIGQRPDGRPIWQWSLDEFGASDLESSAFLPLRPVSMLVSLASFLCYYADGGDDEEARGADANSDFPHAVAQYVRDTPYLYDSLSLISCSDQEADLIECEPALFADRLARLAFDIDNDRVNDDRDRLPTVLRIAAWRARECG